MQGLHGLFDGAAVLDVIGFIGQRFVDFVQTEVQVRLKACLLQGMFGVLGFGRFGIADFIDVMGELIGGRLQLSVGLGEGLSRLESALGARGVVLFEQGPIELRSALQRGDASQVHAGIGDVEVSRVLVDEFLKLLPGLVVKSARLLASASVLASSRWTLASSSGMTAATSAGGLLWRRSLRYSSARSG